ncbi:hypothetical protein JCGZ_19688 [Jatropha curcas]|uniref:Uncharacterized protein n=1 Tax=Jatropha curcas TaxID=180498 RepID=A0A067L8B4_JATCU|nr:hypothetical protein JCGZ_19688 [Jatropha curcas]
MQLLHLLRGTLSKVNQGPDVGRGGAGGSEGSIVEASSNGSSGCSTFGSFIRTCGRCREKDEKVVERESSTSLEEPEAGVAIRSRDHESENDLGIPPFSPPSVSALSGRSRGKLRLQISIAAPCELRHRLPHSSRISSLLVALATAAAQLSCDSSVSMDSAINTH